MKKILAIVLCLAMVLSVVACAKATPAPAAEEAPAAAEAAAPAVEKKTYAIVYPLVHSFFEPIGKGAQKYVDEQGLPYEILIKAPQQADVKQQIEIVENLISMKVDGIAIGPCDADALIDPINRAVEAGIPVICFDTDSPNSKRAGYIGTDNVKGGYALGEAIIDELGEGKIFVLNGNPSQLNHIQRLEGLSQALEGSKIELLDVQTGMGDPNLSITTVEAMIEAYPDFDALVGVGGDAGPAGIAIWKAKGWTGENREKKIITFDNTDENIQGLRDGIIDTIVSQNQHTWGKLIVDNLDALNAGGTMEPNIDTGTIVVTLDNVDTYQN